MSTLKIEKIGGLAGFGGPRSNLESSGECLMSALPADEQAALEALFQKQKGEQGSSQERDTFRYRITRIMKGKSQTVEVPESAVPQALKACVSDRLK